jgi:hypothetical protein
MGHKNETSLLDGVSGIGLVLISSQLEEAPTWDGSFLLS